MDNSKSPTILKKEKWSVDDLISICAQEEARLKSDKADQSVNLIHSAIGNMLQLTMTMP